MSGKLRNIRQRQTDPSKYIYDMTQTEKQSQKHMQTNACHYTKKTFRTYTRHDIDTDTDTYADTGRILDMTQPKIYPYGHLNDMTETNINLSGHLNDMTQTETNMLGRLNPMTQIQTDFRLP